MNSNNFKKTTNIKTQPPRQKTNLQTLEPSEIRPVGDHHPSHTDTPKGREWRREKTKRKTQAQNRKSWNYSKFNYLRNIRKRRRTNNLRITDSE
jgi:hypothetical protein